MWRLGIEELRLIPAHAGKTRRARQMWGAPGAHPRSRGENKDALAAVKGTAGSSPLTRGKRARHGHEHYARRLIPAHAGKTFFEESQEVGVGAHPRSRGENLTPAGVLVIEGGSSPLTRGKRRRRRRQRGCGGLIPAHAGKTHANRRLAVAHAAHPRSRGENAVEASVEGGGRGSSPLTRGKLLR